MHKKEWMLRKLIMVGGTTQNNKLVNGQSMMFQLFLDNLKEKGINTILVDFGKSIDSTFYSKRVSGKFSIIKLIDNFLLLFRFIYVTISNPKTPVYINTSQSKVGFLRDYLFINFAKFLNRKIVAHQFGANYRQFYASQSSEIKNKIKKTLQKADTIVVEGDFVKEQFSFLEEYKTKVISIPNGLPEKIDSTSILPKKIDENKPIQLFYLSNLIESKGYWDVLEAVNILVNREKIDVQSIFSGRFLQDIEDEKFKSSLEAKSAFLNYIKENNLESRVEYYEGLYGFEKSNAFRKAHFFLLPSYYLNEGQPVSILEALAYGCVPIVTNYRVIPSMVNETNGFFVNPKTPEDIVKVIKDMVKAPIQYVAKSEAGIEYYKSHFTADKFVSRLIKLF